MISKSRQVVLRLEVVQETMVPRLEMIQVTVMIERKLRRKLRIHVASAQLVINTIHSRGETDGGQATGLLLAKSSEI